MTEQPTAAQERAAVVVFLRAAALAANETETDSTKDLVNRFVAEISGFSFSSAADNIERGDHNGEGK